MINLVKNSVDAIKDLCLENGVVTISINKSDADRQIFIDVIDNAPGLAPEIKKNPLSPFKPLWCRNRDSALGFRIRAKILEDHKGNLEYIPTEDGCHFRLRLPMIELIVTQETMKSCW